MLFIIECKTWGKEYDKALKDTYSDGAQLFSYWQQEQSTKWLVLYASNFADGKIEYKAPTINCTDDANILLLAKSDDSIKLYKNAHTAPERFDVWNETYINLIYDNLIFSADSVAYNIGVKPLLKKDLADFTPEDRIVNKFEEILRHNNVSDKENAFNRLVALFICKLVDEITKSDDDEVEFQYKQGTDTYETLQDRLQRLHRDGMETFMKEKIFYVSSDYPEWLFATYTGSKRKKAIEDLQNTIRILKFYSNNDFAFKDVHNEELFYQNGKILVEMVQLFEKYRIVYPSKHQFLGDLFEQLLNKGFKQNEGQFFTPMPITRFIWDSLPIKNIISSERGTAYPKVIDYACGAGHFLTEAVEAINYYTDSENNAWVKDHIFGIEKDYRLARVAKISLFMNGAGEANVIFGDGLESAPDKQIENGTFDILVANPPYAVKDFKQHLLLKNNSFDLLDKIGNNGSEIEVLFVERIAQLLKPNGIAAVILPISLLSNDSASYIGAREHLLKNFYIHGIVVLGSKTFGATGQKTIIAFLEKFNEPPKRMDLASDTADAIISGENLSDWKDNEILEAYIAQIEIEEETYVDYLKKSLSIDELCDSEYFEMYVKSFEKSAEAKNLIKSKSYKLLDKEQQESEYLRRLYSYINSVESEKLYYFSLVFDQKTVIIKAPTENKEQVKFLGYDWSNRKGNEGIQIINPGGKLYDDANRETKGTLANALKTAYGFEEPTFPENMEKIASVLSTKDMLDFSRSSFNKAIRTQGNRKISIVSKYELVELKKVADIQKGTAITQADTNPGEYKVVAGGVSYAYSHNSYNREPNIITISASGANAGFVNYWGERIFASDCTTVQAENAEKTKWIYYYLKLIQSQIIEILQKGSAQPHVYPEDIKTIPIPNIDDSTIKRIVNDCEEINTACGVFQKDIEDYRKEIAELYNKLDLSKKNRTKYRLSDDVFTVSIGQRVLNKELVEDGAIPVYSANVFEPFGYVNDLLIEDFSSESVLWGIDGDWMVNTLPKDTPFYPTDHCGVLRCKTEAINPRYLAHILEREGITMGFSRSYRASIDRVEGISFTVPDITEQNNVISKIIELENKIAEAEKKIKELQNKTSNILESYLQ